MNSQNNTPTEHPLVICTIVSKNYLATSRTLMRSIREFHDDVHLVTLLVDKIDDYFDPADEPYEVWLAEDLDIPHWEHFCFKYDILELNTAVKPYLLEKLYDTYNADKVIYFDPDIVVYSSLGELFGLLDEHMGVLTPHILDPLKDDKRPSELDFLRIGTYNLGFFASSRKGQWRDLLHWWQSKVYNDCTREVDKGLFVDQHWMDLAPSLFGQIFVLRKPNYNLAYWNFKTRDLQMDTDGVYTVDGYPLVFFHYSGYSIQAMEEVSKHQDRFKLSDLNPAFRMCFENYAERLRENGYETVKNWPYVYNQFADEVPITDPMRIYLRYEDPNGEKWTNPFATDAEDTFREYIRDPHSLGHKYLSPYALTLYQMRLDLQEAFPNVMAGQEEALARWFIEYENSAPEFHPFVVAPMKEALYQKRRQSSSASRYNFKARVAHLAVDTSAPSQTESGAASLEFNDTETDVAQIIPQLSAPVGVGQVGLKKRLKNTRRYHRDFPTKIAPHLPPDRVGGKPRPYMGGNRLYGYFRKGLIKLGVLNGVRRVFNRRLRWSVYYFFNRSHELDFNVRQMPPRIQTSNIQLPTVQPTPVISAPLPTQPTHQLSDGVNLVGYLYSETGVGQISRNVMRALGEIDFPTQVLPIEAHDPSRKNDRLADEFPQGTEHRINVFHVNADMTYPVKELVGADVYQNHYNIGFWFWELSKFPTMWHTAFAAYDEIWVASSFIHEALATISPIPVVKIPVTIAPQLPPEPVTRADFDLPEEAFIFMMVFNASSIIERKNPFAIIRTFEQAFTAEERAEKVRLVIKTTHLADFPERAEQLREAVALVNGLIIDRYFDRLHTNAFINQCDAYAALHRSEGFGLPIAEAMYLGKPVMATAYSANVDFMTPDNSYMVPYRLIELEHDYPPYEKGSVWADADIDAAAQIMRQIYENPAEARQRGQNGADYIRQHYNAEVVGQALRRRLNFILDNL